jgi:tetratricopeptide (TPR) repeat protein
MAPVSIEQLFGTARMHHQAGRPQYAEALYRQILSIQPRHADAMSMLAIVLAQSGRAGEALTLAHQAVSLAPQSPVLHFNRGIVCAGADRLADAITSYRAAIALEPTLFEAHNNLANLLRKTGQLESAISSFRQAIALRPDSAATYFNLGNALQDLGNSNEAAAAYARAIALQPNHAEAHLNLGNILRMANQSALAAEHYRAALLAKPDFPEAQWSMGLHHLQQGRLEQGWPLFEARLRVPEFPVRRFREPIWDGSPLHGRRIVLHPEGGFGDAIQFFRFARLVHEQRGGRVLFLGPPELRRLFSIQPGIERYDVDGETIDPFDFHCPLLSLPLRFGTTIGTIPQVPYLEADPQLVEQWQRRLGPADGRMKIGLVWAGSQRNLNDVNRSMSMDQLAPLADIGGVRFIGLQKERWETPPAGMEIENFSSELTDYAQTAALAANLDLAICVDTSVAHLCGALGKPTWVPMCQPTEWRWLLEREDSPWYASMRLFRQPRAGDWETPMKRIAEALRARVGDFRQSGGKSYSEPLC